MMPLLDALLTQFQRHFLGNHGLQKDKYHSIVYSITESPPDSAISLYLSDIFSPHFLFFVPKLQKHIRNIENTRDPQRSMSLEPPYQLVSLLSFFKIFSSPFFESSVGNQSSRESHRVGDMSLLGVFKHHLYN